MDYVDDFHANFVDLNDLQLAEQDLRILESFASAFPGVRSHYVLIQRGLSSAVKVVIKPESLYPLLVKLDSTESIKKEEVGDRLLRYRVPPLSIPPLEGVRYQGGRGAIAYRYVTGGRVRHLIRRFDTALPDLSTYTALAIIDDIFDVILKKCHWMDGQYKLQRIELPDIPQQEVLAADPNWKHMVSLFTTVRRISSQITAPHGIIHGDLHSKNILITRDDAPVIIDFAMARSESCHYQDFARFEAFLQFQVDALLADEFWRIEALMYGETPLYIPHSNSKLAACVQRIRSNLLQGCTRMSLRMDHQEVDLGYRAYLIYSLIRFYGRTENSIDARNRAYHQVCGLAKAFERA